MSSLKFLVRIGRTRGIFDKRLEGYQSFQQYHLPNATHMRCLSQFNCLPAAQYIKASDSPLIFSIPTVTSRYPLLVRAPCLTQLSVRTYAKNKGKDKGSKGPKKVKLTSEQLEGVVDLDKVTQELDRVLEDLKDKFIHQVTVRTSHGVFNNLTVKTPDGNFPLIQLGQVTQKNPQLVVINLAAVPQYVSHVKEAIGESGLNVNPQQDGTSLFVAIPKVTREHREGLVKSAKMLSEKSKKQLRDVFSKYARKIKASKEGHSADDLKAADDMVKDLMHDKLKHVDEMTEMKKQELLGGK